MRSVSRTLGVSFNAISRLLRDSGEAAWVHHDQTARGLQASYLQADEIWGFAWCKERALSAAKAAPPGSGSIWTWTCLDADSKFLVSYLVGRRDYGSALYFVSDIRERVDGRFQLSTDGLTHYRGAVEEVFGSDIDYGMQIKEFGKPETDEWRRYSPSQCLSSHRFPVMGYPNPDAISTSYVERMNLTLRMGMRRLTRLTNGFSKKAEQHAAMVALYAYWYNHCRPHLSLRSRSDNRVTPAMVAGLAYRPSTFEELIALVDELAPKPNRPKTYRKRRFDNSELVVRN